MTQLVFPKEWIRDTTNQRATHCFRIVENDRNNMVLITITQFMLSNRPYIVQAVRGSLEQQIFEEKDNMVEKDVKTQLIQNDNGMGYYFMANDLRWHGQPDDWPSLMRCIYVTKTHVIEMTVLCHSLDSPIITQAMDVLANCTD